MKLIVAEITIQNKTEPGYLTLHDYPFHTSAFGEPSIVTTVRENRSYMGKLQTILCTREIPQFKHNDGTYKLTNNEFEWLMETANKISEMSRRDERNVPYLEMEIK